MEKLVWKPGTMLYPIPAVMVSCCDMQGRANIITVAWTGTVCTDPPMMYISVRPERFSHGLICMTGEFVVNIPTRDLAWATDLCGVKSGRDTDKWAAAHLSPAPASAVRPPLISECPVGIECRVSERKELGSHDMFLAEVVALDVSADLVDATGRLQLGASGLFGYAHGEYWGLDTPLGHFGYSVRKKAGPTVRTRVER